MRRLVFWPLVGTVLSAGARADELCHTADVALSPTAWQRFVALPRYDGAEPLESIELRIAAHLEGDVGAENTAGVAAAVQVDWTAQVSILRTNGSTLVGAAPGLVLVADLEAFDGTVDFAGPSGVAYPGLTADAEGVLELEPDSVDGAPFTGTGMLLVAVRATGTSAVSPGAVASIGQSAAATVTVCYRTPSAEPPIASYCTAAPNSTGQPATLAWSGSPSLTGEGLTLTAAPVPMHTFGLLACSPDAAQTPLGPGFLCLGTDTYGHVLRLGGAWSWRSGELVHELDLAAPRNRRVTFTPGSTWHFQGWYLDRRGRRYGFNLTDGLRVTFAP